MNAMRWGLFCALVGWMATAAEAQWGTYGSPDPIPFGQSVPPNPYLPAAASRTAYLTGVDDPGAALRLPPSGNIPQPPSESAATMMMLNEPAPTVVPRGNVPPAADAINDAGRGDACGSVCFGNCCDLRWYASFEALYMTRNQPSEFCTSIYAPADGSLPVNRGGFNGMDWIWGGQATLGYRFGCCCDWALEATYWGLAESCTDGTPNNIPSCPYVSTMNLSMVSILGTTGGAVTPTNPNGYQTADYYTNNSPDNHIWRNWNVQNVELNFVRPLCCGGCNRFGVDFLAGVRWLHFQDGFLFGAERVDDGSPYAGDWLFMDDHITNDLVGFQAGFNANYCFADCWKVFFRPVVGVFNNYVSLDYNLYAVSCTTGAQYQGSSQTFTNPNYPIHANTDGFSFLTQVDLGLDWQICRHVSAELGYRVVAMTGMALSDSQFPSDGSATQCIAEIKHNDGLLLHGAFTGVTFTW